MRKSEIIALLGSNGAGKSTLLRCIIGLTPISSGKVTSLGHAFESSPTTTQLKEIRQQTGFVFQSHHLVKQQSSLSNVCHGLFGRAGSWRGWNQRICRGDWRKLAMQALDEVNLAHLSHQRVSTLSGGQAQRVAIARALVRKPKLLLADEPAASLDPIAGGEVMSTLQRSARLHQSAVLFTTHNLEHALDYADRVLVLANGNIVLNECAAELSVDMLTERFHLSDEPREN